MDPLAPLLLELLTPAAPSSKTVLAYLQASPVQLSTDALDQLLASWSKPAALHKENANEVSLLVQHLMERGASPWRVDGLVGGWVRNHHVAWVKQAFDLLEPQQRQASIPPEWLNEAVQNSSPMVELLLSLGAQPWRRDAQGVTALHLAQSASFVEQLCEAGANPDQRNYRQTLPIQGWLNPLKPPHASASYRDAHAQRIMALFRSCLKRGNAGVEGLELAPFLLAANGKWKEAAMVGRLTRSGFEVVEYEDARMGASPLSAWAWSVFQGKEGLRSMSGAGALLEQCFASREGTWDHEWVLAAAAFIRLHRHGSSSSLGHDRVRRAIASRLEELAGLPSLTGEGSRLQSALHSVGAMAGSMDWARSLCAKAVPELAFALTSPSAVGFLGMSAMDLDECVEAASKGSTWPACASQIDQCFANGIPRTFWNSIGSARCAWLGKIKQAPLVEAARKRLADGAPLPDQLRPLPSWPADVMEMIRANEQSRQLDENTPIARPRTSPRRM